MIDDALAGKVAVVTGGASGIGRAVEETLARRGVHVIVVDIRDPGSAAEVRARGGDLVAGDVGDESTWERVVELAHARWGRLDMAHLNAGVVTGTSAIEDVSLEQYRRVMGVNVDGVFLGARAVVPLMARTGGGIVITSSIGGIRPFPHDPVYALTKQGVAGFARSLAAQLAHRRITVNAVCPGAVDTAIIQERTRARLTGLGMPLMPAQVVADLVADLLAGIETGQVYALQIGNPPYACPLPAVPDPVAPGVDAEAFTAAQETWAPVATAGTERA